MQNTRHPLLTELEDILRFMPSFIRNPVEGIRSAPEWSWSAIFAIQTGTAALSGVIVGVMSASFWNLLAGLVVFPITSLVQLALIAIFTASYFAVFHSTYIEWKRLASVVVLANIPYYIVHVLSGVVSVFDLVGFLASCVLMVVGLTSHFRLERAQVIRLMVGVYVVFLVVWGTAQYRSTQRDRALSETISPKSVDALEREVKSTK